MNYLIFAVILLSIISILLLIIIFHYKNKFSKIKYVKNSVKSDDINEISKIKDELIKKQIKLKNEILALEELRDNKLEKYVNGKTNNIDSFFMEISKSININKNANQLFKELALRIRDGNKLGSKLVMNLAEFKKQNGWDLIINLFGTYRLLNSSEEEKTSWITNFSPLRALFYPENDVNYLENTWISFEQEIHYDFKGEKQNYFPYRIDLLFMSKLNNKYNVLLLEMKQTTFNKTKNKKETINEFNKKMKIHWSKVLKNINNKNNFNKLSNLGYLYNMPINDVKKFNDDWKKWYSFNENDALGKKIYCLLTDYKNKKNELDKLNFDEVSKVLNDISGVKYFN